MVVGLKKLPIMVDLTHGTIGMWAGWEDTSQDGMVIPKFYPYNSMRLIKPTKTDFLVPRQAIIGPFQPSTTEKEGVPREMVLIMESDKGSPVKDYMEEELDSRLERIQAQLEEKEWEARQERRKRRESEDEIESEKRQKQSRGGRRRRPDGRPSFKRG